MIDRGRALWDSKFKLPSEETKSFGHVKMSEKASQEERHMGRLWGGKHMACLPESQSVCAVWLEVDEAGAKGCKRNHTEIWAYREGALYKYVFGCVRKSWSVVTKSNQTQLTLSAKEKNEGKKGWTSELTWEETTDGA